jgi:hypothetical protein
MQHQPHAERQDFQVAIGGLEYPVSKDGILNHARDHGGLDSEVIAVLVQLTDREYEDQTDLEQALRTVYSEQDVPPDAMPI